VAFHEAGHAVAADWYAVDFTATIDDVPHISMGSTYVDVACQVMFAGPLAQAKYQKQGLLSVLITDGVCDMEYIEAHAEMWADIGLKDEKRRQWKKAAQWVISKRWDLVGAVAERLLECGTLTSDEVRTIASSLGHDWQDECFPYD
jgi:hypothetical protein